MAQCEEFQLLQHNHFLDVSDAPNIPWYPAVAIDSGGPTTTLMTAAAPPGSDRSLLVDVSVPSHVFLFSHPGQTPIPLLLPLPALAPPPLQQQQPHRDSDAPAPRRLPSRMQPP